MIILTLTDFRGGKYNIPDAQGWYTNGNMQAMIDTYEKPYIYNLLGVVLGDKIIAYLAANRLPANTDYNKIIDPFSSDDAGWWGWYNDYCDYWAGYVFNYSSIVTSLGLKEYLKAGIFYEYIKNGLITSQPGVAAQKAEAGTIQNSFTTMRFADNKFNDVLGTIEAIQWYCLNNNAAFPDFNGQRVPVKMSNFFI